MIPHSLRSARPAKAHLGAGWLGLALAVAAAGGQPAMLAPAGAPEPPGAEAERNVLIDRAIDFLQLPRGIVAKVRLRGDMYRQHLVGTGTYQQYNIDDEQLLNMDLKLSMHGKVASFQRVNDGRSIWVRTDLPTEDGQWDSSVERLDLTQWQREASPLDSAPIPWGDLAHLLTQLQTRFSFDRPQTMSHHGIPAWLLSGRRRTPLAEGGSESMPNEVILVIGKDDVFPYLIEFRRRDGGDVDEGGSPVVVTGGGRTLLTVEFFEVAFPPQLNRDAFQFRAGEIPVHDVPP